MICYVIFLKKSSVCADNASDRPVGVIRNGAPFKSNNEKRLLYTGKIMPNKCYRFVTVLYFFRYFLCFLLFNLLGAERTRAASSYRTFSQVYLYGMRLHQVICAQMTNYSHFFLITKRILRKEFHHTAGERRLLPYAQTAECHLRKSRYERSKKIIFLDGFFRCAMTPTLFPILTPAAFLYFT
jgi:hypothetical protein